MSIRKRYKITIIQRQNIDFSFETEQMATQRKRKKEKLENIFPSIIILKENQFVTCLFSSIYLYSDGLSHSAKRLSESHRLDLLRNITELLGRTFSSQFVFPVLGHEDVQNNDYKDYKSFLLSLGNIWRQWLVSYRYTNTCWWCMRRPKTSSSF